MIDNKRLFVHLLSVCLFMFTDCADAKPSIEGEVSIDPKEMRIAEKKRDVDDVMSRLGATKYINNCDFEHNNVFKPFPMIESVGASAELIVDHEVKYQGEGSYQLKYSFTEKNVRGGAQVVAIKQNWYDMYRSDLSFHPLAISLWVNSHKGNGNAITVKLLQQDEVFSLSYDEQEAFAYTDSMFLNRDGWNRLIIPYKWFVPEEGNNMKELNLKRVNGIQIEVVNVPMKKENGTIYIDAIQQLTSFEPKITETATFSSIFVQLHNPTHHHYDWKNLFEEYLEVGIDSLIVQRTVNYPNQVNTFWYSGSSLTWKENEYYLNQIFNAAEATGMKVVVGLNQGRFPDDKGDAASYDALYERNKKLIDELYELFSSSPAFSGWYIAEEFHDGAWMGWLNAQRGALLSNYLNRVAKYAKSRERKFIVTIAPALWRGRPADMTYHFYKSILEKTPDIDIMYLQDCGGRCSADEDDYDVYLPQYFEMIKKACDETGVQFGVDIESFENCANEGLNYEKRSWLKLKPQLEMASLFTKNITQFSWSSFRPGVGAFEAYKEYLRTHHLLRSQQE